VELQLIGLAQWRFKQPRELGFTMTGMFRCDGTGHAMMTWEFNADTQSFRLVHFQIADPSFDMPVIPHDLEPDAYATQMWRMLSDEKITGEPIGIAEVASGWLTARNIRGPRSDEAFKATFASLVQQDRGPMAGFRDSFDSHAFTPFTDAEVKDLLTAEVYSQLVEAGEPSVTKTGARLRDISEKQFSKSLDAARHVRGYLIPAKGQGGKPQPGTSQLTAKGRAALAVLYTTHAGDYDEQAQVGWSDEDKAKVRELIDQHGPPLPLTPEQQQDIDHRIEAINNEEAATAEQRRRIRERNAHVTKKGNK